MQQRLSRLVHRLRFDYDKAYRIRIGAGFEFKLTKRQKRALVAMCKDFLANHERCTSDPERTEIYAATVKLYEADAFDVIVLHEIGLSRVYRNHEGKLKRVKPEFDDFDEIVEYYAGYYWS